MYYDVTLIGGESGYGGDSAARKTSKFCAALTV